MAAYNIYEAKTKFSALVEKAANGEEVVISKAGKPLLKLVPINEKTGMKAFADPDQVLQRMTSKS